MTFIRKTEDFICENCGAVVVGNGYTNHCPVCLYSKHVDRSPGDRAAGCGGLMEPVAVALKRGEVTQESKTNKSLLFQVSKIRKSCFELRDEIYSGHA